MLLPPPVPPGWYTDPWLAEGQRWWNGQTWTYHVFLPAPTPEVEPERTFPFRLGFIAAAILVVSLVLERGAGYAIGRGLKLASPYPVVALAVLLGYGPSVGFCFYAARRWGQRGVMHSLGTRFRAIDFGWGPLTWVCMILGQIVLALLIKAVHVPLSSNVPTVNQDVPPDKLAFLIFATVGVVIAPLAEELVFRGVILAAFRSRLSLAWAAVAQGVLFGLVHMQPTFGWGNIGLVILLSWVGSALGFAAGIFKRIWPGIFAHAMMNALVFLILYGRIYWDWKLPQQSWLTLHTFLRTMG
jgi:membrane protease YdiL (CAAX protease family)